MDYYAVSASSFADYMGVGRSSISHILSGRNKPSLDFVMKITEAYTDVDLKWLLYGEGTFPKSEVPNIEEKKNLTEAPPVYNVKHSSTLNPKQDLFSESAPENESIDKPISAEEKKTIAISSDSKIDRIVIFYEDGTFSSYQMKKT
ncbi:transcriptional regulator [Aquimarina muelleri]|uniref:Transcriptional regulator n=2 Tax=Aquimarina muelleri TaxID=279356 RepID=A0A918JYK2_9FLAO|nr:transcriptional regulator [Aquimarina muelleri]